MIRLDIFKPSFSCKECKHHFASFAYFTPINRCNAKHDRWGCAYPCSEVRGSFRCFMKAKENDTHEQD